MEPPATKRFKEKLAKFIEANEAHPKTTDIFALAKLFLEREPVLSGRFLLEETARFMQAEKRKALRAPNPEEAAQMQFLGEDFTRLFNGPGHWLPLKGGINRRLRAMTASQLRESAKVIRARITPRSRMKAEYLESLADQMSPYVKVHPGLKFGDYLELAAAGITPSPKSA